MGRGDRCLRDALVGTLISAVVLAVPAVLTLRLSARVTDVSEVASSYSKKYLGLVSPQANRSFSEEEFREIIVRDNESLSELSEYLMELEGILSSLAHTMLFCAVIQVAAFGAIVGARRRKEVP